MKKIEVRRSGFSTGKMFEAIGLAMSNPGKSVSIKYCNYKLSKEYFYKISKTLRECNLNNIDLELGDENIINIKSHYFGHVLILGDDDLYYSRDATKEDSINRDDKYDEVIKIK